MQFFIRFKLIIFAKNTIIVAGATLVLQCSAQLPLQAKIPP